MSHMNSDANSANAKNSPEPNRLKDAKSPYLLQHARNPVHWHPWDKEALDKAKTEDKPICLSIGYSTCHWCHVMAAESFSDPDIAEIMNKNFVCIKVDREERPDIDKVYMTAVTLLNRSGGWPLNVFLSPDLKPFFGGTYFPPHSVPGMTGWAELCEKIAAAWKDPATRRNLSTMAARLHAALQFRLNWQSGGGDVGPETMDQVFAAFSGMFDEQFGGFGTAPKFPSPGILSFLSAYDRFAPDTGPSPAARKTARNMIRSTLLAMCAGGIYDHVGGGFHRYATDEKWRVPHFEKMLYDNAQLVMGLADAWRGEKLPVFKDKAVGAIDFVLGEMTDPAGGFYAALDADSASPDTGAGHGEGAFYLWTHEELTTALGDDAAVFISHFGVLPRGNVAVDPHGEFAGKNILYEAASFRDTAARLGTTPDLVQKTVERCLAKLKNLREKRPRPFTDDKLICSWNALMISALAGAFRSFGEKRFLNAAQKAARFILARMYDKPAKTLYRIWRENGRDIPAFAEDHAFLLKAMVDLFEADHDPEWLAHAEELADLLMEKFHDPAGGGFFDTAKGPNSDQDSDQDGEEMPRTKEDTDSVVPSAGSAAAAALARLFAYMPEKRAYMDTARSTANAVLTRLGKSAAAAPEMLAAEMAMIHPPAHVVVCGAADSPETAAMLEVLNQPEGWRATRMLVSDEPTRRKLARFDSAADAMAIQPGKTWAQVCRGFQCQAPVFSADELRKKLDDNNL